MEDPPLKAAVEGIGDVAVARKLALTTGFKLADVYVKNGKRELDRKIPAYAAAARFAPWLVLRDLDHDADCPPTLLGQLLPDQNKTDLLLRIPVRTVESWLLADVAALAGFLGLSSKTFPTDPEGLDRPKRTLVDLARRARNARIRRDIVPEEGLGSEVGPG